MEGGREGEREGERVKRECAIKWDSESEIEK